MSKDSIKEEIEYAYNHSDDYVNWTWISILKKILKEKDNDSTGTVGRRIS